MMAITEGKQSEWGGGGTGMRVRNRRLVRELEVASLGGGGWIRFANRVVLAGLLCGVAVCGVFSVQDESGSSTAPIPQPLS